MPFLSRFGRIASASLLAIGAIPLTIVMTVVRANSIGRTIFRTPATGAIEIAGLRGSD